MPHMISDPGHPAWPAFLTFLQRAALAQQNDQAEAHAIWLEAAALLQAVDGDTIGLITGGLLEHRRHHDVAFAAIIAQLRPDEAIVSFRLGYALQFANRHHDTLAPYRHALALDPQTPQLRTNLAGALALALAGGDPAEQIELLESALKADPFDSNARTNLAQASRVAMNLPRALEAGVRAIELAPDSPMALNNYALALKEAQRWDEAVQLTQTACERAPGDPTMRSSDAAPRPWRLRTRLARTRSALARLLGTGWQPAGNAGAAVAVRIARGQDAAGVGRTRHGRPAAVLPVYPAAGGARP
jgi:tetratricopeptide (TPR) repeat protein